MQGGTGGYHRMSSTYTLKSKGMSPSPSPKPQPPASQATVPSPPSSPPPAPPAPPAVVVESWYDKKMAMEARKGKGQLANALAPALAFAPSPRSCFLPTPQAPVSWPVHFKPWTLAAVHLYHVLEPLVRAQVLTALLAYCSAYCAALPRHRTAYLLHCLLTALPTYLTTYLLHFLRTTLPTYCAAYLLHYLLTALHSRTSSLLTATGVVVESWYDKKMAMEARKNKGGLASALAIALALAPSSPFLVLALAHQRLSHGFFLPSLRPCPSANCTAYLLHRTN